ncbi:hypothetical protein CLV59_103656 [Chitinophaga dinghuensis]|uniref:Uncharacterized protein n=1 Tax=Chitinophaga dinghuensis TaxID=1539050 RepID=A0A327W6P6_9BACT|nr:hypothetical protein [Chitinophaga dinghuensis]RAJ83684.1 hypothetical protein CLV59_103656 [Chitinophaga dinghuensis]
MITKLDISGDIPAGDLQLFDHYVPALEGGSHFIHITQTLKDGTSDVNTDPINSVQEFVVVAPQFSIDTPQVINRYPPAGTTGLYGEVLPHIVLKDPFLPWERDMKAKGTPWLALMVFQEDELTDGEDPEVKSSATTVGTFMQQPAPVLVPGISVEADIPTTAPCRFINIPVAVFQQHAPYLNELPFLSHLRKINTGDRPIMGLNEHGLFSVVASNRFAAAPTSATVKTVKNIVHLVSLEGLHDYLQPNANFGNYTSVSLITLDSWAFYSLPDLKEDFRALVLNLVAQETSQGNIDPTLLWLKLPSISTGADNALQEVSKRINDGYVPIAYHTRTGENTFAWYRGPLTPLLPQPNIPDNPYPNSDAALIFDKTRGIFDVSLAAAWETGRSAALADAKFEQSLIGLRKNVSRKADELYYRSVSPHFKNITDTMQSGFLDFMTASQLERIKAIADKPAAVQAPSVAPKDRIISVQTYKETISSLAAQEQLGQLINKESDPLSDWVSQLMLLYKLPFDCLVPDERLLPNESLRFFYLDKNWLNAAADGAMSLGLESSKAVFFNEQIRKQVIEDAKKKVAVIRARLLKKASINDTTPEVMSGMLLRSALVTGWPNLEIKPKDEAGKPVSILRIDHPAPDILLIIFTGVPATVELSEPRESLGFGVDDDGMIVLRNVSSSGTIGAQIGTLKIRDLSGAQQYCMRAANSRVLNIRPDDSNGLIQTITKALQQQISLQNNTLTSSTFAIQLIKSAEAIVFKSQGN